MEEKTEEVKETKKPKKNKGKKIRTKTFEFGVGELGGNNLPIVVPVISSKHPKGKKCNKQVLGGGSMDVSCLHENLDLQNVPENFHNSMSFISVYRAAQNL